MNVLFFNVPTIHDDVIKWKHFPRYCPIVRGIHRSPVNSPHKGQWRGALMFSFDLRLNKRLSKQSWGWWFETPSRSLWRNCSGSVFVYSCDPCWIWVPEWERRGCLHKQVFYCWWRIPFTRVWPKWCEWFHFYVYTWVINSCPPKQNSRRLGGHFQMHLLEWNSSNFDHNFTEVCLYVSNWQ